MTHFVVWGCTEAGGGLTGHFTIRSTAEPGCRVLLRLHRSLALRDMFQVKMLVLPGPKLFPGGCPVLYLVRCFNGNKHNVRALWHMGGQLPVVPQR